MLQVWIAPSQWKWNCSALPGEDITLTHTHTELLHELAVCACVSWPGHAQPAPPAVRGIFFSLAPSLGGGGNSKQCEKKVTRPKRIESLLQRKTTTVVNGKAVRSWLNETKCLHIPAMDGELSVWHRQLPACSDALTRNSLLVNVRSSYPVESKSQPTGTERPDHSGVL